MTSGAPSGGGGGRGAPGGGGGGRGGPAGVAGRRGDLVHENPLSLVPSFPLHQVPCVSSPVAGANLVHEILPPLFFRFLCTKSPAFFRPWPAPTWCTKSRRPLFLRSLCTKSPALFRPWSGGRGASPLASPCFFVLGHHVPEHSSRSRQAVVVPHCPLALVSSSWGTTSPSTAAIPAGRAWCLTAR